MTGHTKSCGCLQVNMGGRNETHGQSKNGQLTPEYCLWLKAKRRARDKEVPFNITLDDIVIPTHCPLLGIPLILDVKHNPNSPSVDEVVPGLGYVPGNFQIISWRANTIKNDATLEELQTLTANLKLQRERLSERTSPSDDAIVQSYGKPTVSGNSLS
jgi:hypothetical protein